MIHDDYFWDGYFTGGAFQLALTLGAAALWDSAMALVTGPSAADLLLNDRVFRHLPLIDLDEVTIGRKVDYWRTWWEHQTNDDYWHQFRHRPEQVRRADLPAGRLVRPVLGLAPARFAAIGDRVPNRVLMGPWSHEEEVETFRGDVDLRAGADGDPRARLAFYDRYLKEAETAGTSARRSSSTSSARTSGAASTSGRSRAPSSPRGTSTRAAANTSTATGRSPRRRRAGRPLRATTPRTRCRRSAATTRC